MGNNASTYQALPLDLSVGTLDRTRTDDREWLGVAEENLFNEAFTNEKYYTLRSRVGSSPATEKAPETPDVGEHKLLNIDEDPTDTIARLAEQLSNNSFSTAYFETVLQKRLTVLERIHLAFSRERARAKVTLIFVDLQSSILQTPIPCNHL